MYTSNWNGLLREPIIMLTFMGVAPPLWNEHRIVTGSPRGSRSLWSSDTKRAAVRTSACDSARFVNGCCCTR